MTEEQIKELLNARQLFAPEAPESSTPQDNPTVYQFAQLGQKLDGPAAQYKLLRKMTKGELHFYWPHVASAIRDKFHQRNGSGRNAEIGVDSSSSEYVTGLSPEEEPQFQQWVKDNKIPWRENPQSDYDMRGFWKGMMSGDPIARRSAQTGHFPDKWKTPYHKTFSDESIYSKPEYPGGHWNGDKFSQAGELDYGR